MTEYDDAVRDETAEATASGQDLREKVRAITLNALTQGKLDSEGIRNVVKSVTDGVIKGSDNLDQADLKHQFKQAFDGLDDALTKSAEAAKLAAQEAMGRTSEFTDNDLKYALNELAELEELFIGTIRLVASQSSEVAQEIVGELVQHFKQTGTSVGEEAKQAVEGLQVELRNAGRDVAKGTVQAGQTMGRQLASITSGILSGMADALDTKSNKTPS